MGEEAPDDEELDEPMSMSMSEWSMVEVFEMLWLFGLEENALRMPWWVLEMGSEHGEMASYLLYSRSRCWFLGYPVYLAMAVPRHSAEMMSERTEARLLYCSRRRSSGLGEFTTSVHDNNSPVVGTLDGVRNVLVMAVVHFALAGACG
ncbi:hypothetical protein CERZMDRAFT_89141 [Cercospora zeae-maydis SCOH1-5]|uniref:Uncharacterized protein n=1 Tax=Cercospora zeae-maydis SCOH1-5 TaxID=717836 RepID=A0A6A6F2V3_9PEZI|nr:hypothetical protein CERZMDRAFT_89141 [Cercospora zeae-maydis SCOH1-5]